MTQESMFGGDEIATDIEPKARARRADPATSKDAANAVGQFSGDHYAKIKQAMAQLGRPCGAEQISATLLRGGVKLDAYQIRKRLPELRKLGAVRVVEEGGHEATRETASGRHERMWALVPSGA